MAIPSASGVALVSRLALTRVPGTVDRELVSLTPLVGVFLELVRDVAGEIAAARTDSQ